MIKSNVQISWLSDQIKSFLRFKTEKVLLENFLSLSMLQVANYLFPLITLPYLVRVLGPEKYGLIAFAQAFIGYFQILTDYGFNLSATVRVAMHKEDKEKLQNILNSVITIKFGLMVLSLILLTLLVISFEKFKQDREIYYLTFGVVIGTVLFPVWFFQGMERMKYITLLNIFTKGIFACAIFIFIKTQGDYWAVPLLNAVSSILAGVLSLWLIHKNFGINVKLIYSPTLLKEYFIYSSKFFLSRISVSIYTSSNTFVLGLFINNTAVGYYSVGEKLYQFLQYIYYPLNQVLYPYMASTKNSIFFRMIFKIVLLFNIVLVVLFFLLANKIFNILFPSQFACESIIVFRILLIALFVVIPSMMMGYPFLAAMGYSDIANKSVIYGSLIHMFGLSTLAFSKHINIYSVAFMVIISESLVFVYRLYYFNKLVKGNIWMRKIEK